MSEARLLSIQVGLPKTLESAEAIGPSEKLWTTGFVKEPVAGPVWVGTTNLAGDRQANTQTHGGPEKAVCVYPFEHYSYWQLDLDLPQLAYGSFGENFTMLGQIEEQMCIGDVFRFGQAMVQVSQPRPPCWRLARRWQIRDFAARMEQSGRTGWYCRVLQEGYLEAGVKAQILERPFPECTVALVNEAMYGPATKTDVIQALASCPLLSASWRESLLKKAAKSSSERK